MLATKMSQIVQKLPDMVSRNKKKMCVLGFMESSTNIDDVYINARAIYDVYEDLYQHGHSQSDVILKRPESLFSIFLITLWLMYQYRNRKF